MAYREWDAADLAAVQAAIKAVGNGDHDGEVDGATYDAVHDAFARTPMWNDENREMCNVHMCFTDMDDPCENIRVKARKLYRGAA